MQSHSGHYSAMQRTSCRGHVHVNVDVDVDVQVVARGRRRGVSPVYVKGPHGQAVTR